MARWREYFEGLLANERAATTAQFESEREPRARATALVIAEWLAEECEKTTAEIKAAVDGLEQRVAVETAKVAKQVRGERGFAGPQGPKGDRGERGPEGRPGLAAQTIVGWEVDRRAFVATPMMSGGDAGAPLDLRTLFETFFREALAGRV
jgi:hypothetical protein